MSDDWRPKISAIMPAFRAEQLLPRAVESLLATQYDPLEIVIVEDGSSDETWSVAQRLQQEHPQIVRALQHPGRANRGVSETRNLGLQACTGKWICFLDADDFVYPHRFQSAAAILANQPEVDGVHQLAEMVYSTEADKQTWFAGEDLFGFKEPVDPDHLLLRLIYGRCWPTSGVLFRRTLLDRTGLFLPHLKIAEDCHLWFRMACVGRLVSGDLAKPVSAYWRHGDSAYQPKLEHRVRYVEALTDFARWMQRQELSADRKKCIHEALLATIHSAIVKLREQQQPHLAWQVIKHCLGSYPRLFGHLEVYRHLRHLIRGR